MPLLTIFQNFLLHLEGMAKISRGLQCAPLSQPPPPATAGSPASSPTPTPSCTGLHARFLSQPEEAPQAVAFPRPGKCFLPIFPRLAPYVRSLLKYPSAKSP